MSCPACGGYLDMDPDGGWCDDCKTYWDINDLHERWAEEDPDLENDEDEDPNEEIRALALARECLDPGYTKEESQK